MRQVNLTVDDLKILKHDIDTLLIDISILSNTIGRMKNLIDLLDNKILIDKYNQELGLTLEQFAVMAKVLIDQIKWYLSESDKLQQPVEFRYHKVLKDYNTAINSI